MSETVTDWFCGAGGAMDGISRVPGVIPTHAANHWKLAVESHAKNFPNVEHFLGDIRKIDVSRLPFTSFFWASPACPAWTSANGQRQDYAKQDAIPGLEPVREVEAERSRALMEEVPMYLAAMALRGHTVLAGVVENVVDVRKWVDWSKWLREFHALGYRTRVVALNSAHVHAPSGSSAPQSRDRLYLTYWHEKLGRDPDWDKWLRPRAWCAGCDRNVNAVQVFKKPGVDMGKYRSQYVYVCPLGHGTLEPYTLPAATAIDWTLPGVRIGDRDKPLVDKTLARVQAGIAKNARPISLAAAGHTFERRPGVRTRPIDDPLTTQTTSTTHAIAVPPMLVPAGGTWRDEAALLSSPMPTRTTRESDGVLVPPMIVRQNSTPDGTDPGFLSTPVDQPSGTLTTAGHQSLVIPPFIAELRGGNSTFRPLDEPLATATASGNHHGLTIAPSHLSPADLMAAWGAIYAYDSGDLSSLRAPLRTQATIVGDALVRGEGLPAVEDCLFRMLEPHEIHAAMAFRPDYQLVGNKSERVRLLGNAVTPNVAEVLTYALMEAVRGEEYEPRMIAA